MVLLRIYWQELTTAEAAVRDNVPPFQVRRARHQAEAALRRMLGGKRPDRA